MRIGLDVTGRLKDNDLLNEGRVGGSFCHWKREQGVSEEFCKEWKVLKEGKIKTLSRLLKEGEVRGCSSAIRKERWKVYGTFLVGM